MTRHRRSNRTDQRRESIRGSLEHGITPTT